MKPRIYPITLIFITLTIVATIALQVRWNVKNFEENKRHLLNDTQIAFDNSVENYFAESTKKDIMLLTGSQVFPKEKLPVAQKKALDSLFSQTQKLSKRSDKKLENGMTVRITSNKIALDSFHDHLPKAVDVENITIAANPKMREFANRIYMSLLQDTINFERLDSLFAKELKRKGIVLDYSFDYSGPINSPLISDNSKKSEKTLSMLSKSTYLPPGQDLKLKFANPFFAILSHSYVEILLSFLFSLAIISCLLFLLRIINRQKKIDEIRNDLISNITHEFKTPITTIGSAIEGIRNFNATNDTEKTNRYLDISERQLGKLQVMVEKLLETATLDTDSLILNKEPIDLVILLNAVLEKFIFDDASRISLKANSIGFFVNGDSFHLENALSNLIDNAIKYGGNEINLRLEKTSEEISIFIEDNGSGIEKWHREQIFEKFYRIPTGNLHDIKGFGIGLFYSRKIIEKHGGKLELLPDAKMTIFKISLPHV